LDYRFQWIFLRQLTTLLAFQQCAVPLFEAYKPPLTQNVTINVKGLINSIALAIELAPSAAWGEPLHVSGLFSVLVDHLADDKVNHGFLFPKDGKPRLIGAAATSRYPHGIHPVVFPDRRSGCTSVRDPCGGDREIERDARGGNLGSHHEPVVE
jgi:hypothetical protein